MVKSAEVDISDRLRGIPNLIKLKLPTWKSFVKPFDCEANSSKLSASVLY